MENTTHYLKVLPEFFEAILKGDKTFEVRKNDRDYKRGDLLYLQEWDGEFTGRKIIVSIPYILDDRRFVKKGYIIMSLLIEKIIR
jgi:hypothetical protein